MNTIVIGGGPAGLTAAYQISKDNPDVTLYEADKCVGGLARSFRLWDQIVDLGPHRFFSKDRRVNELWLEVVGRDYTMIDRQTRILYRNGLFQYPLEGFDVLKKIGLLEAARCVTSYASQCAFPSPQDGSFESWVSRRFGKRLFEIFFKTYSEKLWGIKCQELDADFAAQRIKKFSLSAAIKSALLPQHRKQHRTLVDEFAYPSHGTGMVYERMASSIEKRGGKVHLETPVKRVITEGRKVVGIELGSGEKKPCRKVISTMPLTTLVMQLDAPQEIIHACRELQFRSTILVYLEVLGDRLFSDNWIYVHSPDLRFGRVTNFRNWSPQICEGTTNTILALEYWCNPGDEFWQSDDQKLIDLAQKEIVQSGLVHNTQQLGRSFVFRIPKCYPVYRRGYQDPLRLVREYVDTISGLAVIGRYGSFKYNNQDHSILMGRLAAENVLQEKGHDLWAVNTDYESYQEECSITDSGLVQQNKPVIPMQEPALSG